VVRAIAVAERVAHLFVRHDPRMPRVGQPPQAVDTSDCLIYRCHLIRMA
jgi:hypothetical protein